MRVLTRVALAMVGLFVGLGLAELLLRVTGQAPDLIPIEAGRYRLSSNLLIGYEPIPNAVPTRQTYEALAWAWDYPARANALGYRDDNHEIRKPAGTYRVAVLGDSIAAGSRIKEYEDAFAHRLGERLEKDGLPAEVLNFGVKGYATLQEVATFEERALPFEPDLVLLQWCVNDYRGPPDDVFVRLMEIEASQPSRSARLARTALAHSAIWRFFHYRLNVGRRSGDAGKEIFDKAIPSPDNMTAAFERLDHLTGPRGIAVLVAAFPSFGFDTPKTVDAALGLARSLSARHGFRFVDLAPAFAACAAQGGVPEKSLMLDALHPSAAGHACAADALAAEVEAMRGK